jgi:hypothetical protein
MLWSNRLWQPRPRDLRNADNNYAMPTIHRQPSIPCNIVMKSCLPELQSMIVRNKPFRRKLQTQSCTKVNSNLWEWNRVLTDETTHVICNGGARSTFLSSFENCTDCKPRKVNINLAEGGVVMVTTHEAMKTFYIRTQTEEFRGITTKRFYHSGFET